MLAYEELKGSSGREIWYRPPRYEARKLFPQCPPRVRVRTSVHQLQNISLGGLAAVCNQNAEDLPEVGDVVPLTIQQAGLSIFESDARVCRKEESIFGSKLAFNFVNGFVEFDKLLSRNAQAQIALRSSNSSLESSHLVPKEYRLFCADVLSLLRCYRSVLDENNALAERFGRNFDRDSAYDACESRLIQQFRSLWRAGNEVVRPIMQEREVLHATKELTELVLTPEFRLGPIWDRSYGKPLGYPGDFEVMNQVYDWQRSGSSVYGMLLHRIGLEVAECIKTRMEVVRSNISKTIQARGVDRPARILSLGSGPAREVETLLTNPRGLGGLAEFTLIDQEQAALRYAYERTYPEVMRSGGKAHVQCLSMSFTDILRGVSGLSSVAPQDMIYSVGLLDYLSDRRAGALVRRLYEALAPGGLLIIGNMNETALSNLWPMEFITDWNLYYRDEQQMLAWCQGLHPAMAWTETEITERVRLLFVRKP
jgi:extracellular factor (EF) 3-hydroxypalmitic acid methyl ester biosynthesis protein